MVTKKNKKNFFYLFKLGKIDLQLGKKWLFSIGKGLKFSPAGKADKALHNYAKDMHNNESILS